MVNDVRRLKQFDKHCVPSTDETIPPMLCRALILRRLPARRPSREMHMRRRATHTPYRVSRRRVDHAIIAKVGSICFPARTSLSTEEILLMQIKARTSGVLPGKNIRHSAHRRATSQASRSVDVETRTRGGTKVKEKYAYEAEAPSRDDVKEIQTKAPSCKASQGRQLRQTTRSIWARSFLGSA